MLCHPTEKESVLKGKNLLPLGANSFLSEQINFQKGIHVEKSKQEVTKVVSLLKMGGRGGGGGGGGRKSTKCIQDTRI